MFFPKLEHLKTVKQKFAREETIRIGVFCFGNADRSPTAQQVIQNELRQAGFKNVEVFSFGTSVAKENEPARKSTIEYVKETYLKYSDIEKHKRRNITNEELQKQIHGADLLFGTSAAHVLALLTYFSH